MKTRFLTIGRDGDIKFYDRSVSRQHAVIVISQDSIFLRDLNSTNGTYLVKNNRLVAFSEGYVQLNQTIALGNIYCSVQQLLNLVGADQELYEDGTTKLGPDARSFHLNHPRKKAIPIPIL